MPIWVNEISINRLTMNVPLSWHFKIFFVLERLKRVQSYLVEVLPHVHLHIVVHQAQPSHLRLRLCRRLPPGGGEGQAQNTETISAQKLPFFGESNVYYFVSNSQRHPDQPSWGVEIGPIFTCCVSVLCCAVLQALTVVLIRGGDCNWTKTSLNQLNLNSFFSWFVHFG